MRFIIENDLTLNDFKEIEDIEKSYFDPDTIVPSSQRYDWYASNRDVDIVIRNSDNHEIVGEIAIVPLSKDQYYKFINGEFADTELTGDTMLTYENNKDYYLMFVVVAIKEEYRNNRRALYYLLKGTCEKIKQLQNRGIKYINMCTEGQTPNGQKFIDGFLNLRLMGKTKDNYNLYHFEKDSEDFSNWINIFPNYIESYYNKFIKD